MMDHRIYPGDYTEAEIAAVDRYRKLRKAGTSNWDALAISLPSGTDKDADRTGRTLITYFQQEAK